MPCMTTSVASSDGALHRTGHARYVVGSAGDERGHLVDFGAVQVALRFEVVVGLDVDPEAVISAQRPGQAERFACGDGALAVEDLTDAGLGQPGSLGDDLVVGAPSTAGVTARWSCLRFTLLTFYGRLGV